MVVEINVHHVFKHPLETVARIHFNKYPSEKDKFVIAIKVLEKTWDPVLKIQYTRRVAICQNVIPYALRRITVLNVEHIEMEEHAWLNKQKRQLRLKSYNLTWQQIAICKEQSLYTPHHSNPQWTEVNQTGSIEVKGLGMLGRLIEIFAKKFMHQGAYRGLKIMDELLEEKRVKASMNTSGSYTCS